MPGLKEQIPCLLFADDVVLLADNTELLKRSLEILSGWSDRWAMEIGSSKCFCILATNASQGALEGTVWSVTEGEIPVVSAYRYLGVNLDSNLSVETIIKDRAEPCPPDADQDLRDQISAGASFALG